VGITRPLTTYKQIPSDLSHVTPRLTLALHRRSRRMEKK